MSILKFGGVFRLGTSVLALLIVECSLAAGATGRGAADSPVTSADDQQLESEILSMLAEATEIASKRRMNADYVPGILTILRRDEMLALGVRTVADALSLVPGMVVDRRNYGNSATSVRGLENDGNPVQVLVDSVPLNTGNPGYTTFFELPIAQVERIEVIRGPASALYGRFAFAGLINIVTSDESQVHLRYGDHDTTELGAIYRFDAPERDLSVQLNLAGWNSGGDDLWVEEDYLYTVGQGSVSNAPGPVENGEKYRFGQLQVDIANASFIAQYQSNRMDPFFGLVGVLPARSNRKDTIDLETWHLQGRIDVEPAENVIGALILRWNEQRNYRDFRSMPPGSTVQPGSPVLPDGLYVERKISTRHLEAEAFLEWTGWTDHRWRIETIIAHEKVLDAWRAYNGDILTLEPSPDMRRYSGDFAPIDPDAARTTLSLVVQDEWSIHPQVDLTFGLRYDSYSDAADSFSPRIAGVWRLNDSHLIKAQIAGASFPPTLWQRYYNYALPTERDQVKDSQHAQTAEISYIFRKPDIVARLNLYHSEVSDVLISSIRGIYERGNERLQGIEMEWEQRFGHDYKLMANLSYADTLHEKTGGPIIGAAKWLGNLSLFYQPRNDLVLAGRWRYVGDRARSAMDSRTDPLNAYNDLSVTLSWFDVGVRGLTLRAGATNLLNEAIRSPAPPNTFANDYPLVEDASFWAQMSYSLP